MPQLPLRGVVTDDFISQCLADIPDGPEYLVVELARRTAGSQSWFHFDSGESHEELKVSLEYSRDALVAVGLWPDWLYDNNDVTSAIVPDASGSVKGGAY
ncbi:hypothetical protein [Roseimicrobium gellanilyticum]|uniref:hypothetical protein n=1 Tax=Roseimicrobium gellanilyticum TaxID=748857 RepID=UPI0011BF4701|nr:hypothetical protein [Roseimicrobium gellanilyticum]